MLRATTARCTTCKSAEGPRRWRSTRVALLDHFPDGPLDVAEGRPECSPARIEHDIPPRIEFGAVQAERLAQTPLDAVSVHASTDRARNCEAQAGAGSCLVAVCAARTRQAKRGEEGAGNARAVVIHFSKVGGAQSGSEDRRAASRINWRSGRLSRRLRSACDGRGPGGAIIRPGRPCSSSALGTRAFWRAYDCSVEMSVSAYGLVIARYASAKAPLPWGRLLSNPV